MSKVLIEITTENAAFGDTPHYEVARILRRAADRIDKNELPDPGELGYALLDLNGNRVGSLTTE